MTATIHLPTVTPRIEESSHENLSLPGELRRRIAGEVRFDAGSRAPYATDHPIYRQVPIGVVIPRSIDAAARPLPCQIDHQNHE